MKAAARLSLFARLARLALLALVSMVTFAGLARAQAEEPSDPGFRLVNARHMQELLQSRAQRLPASAGVDPDTVWFGHSYSDHWSATSNYWNLYTGVNRPSKLDTEIRCVVKLRSARDALFGEKTASKRVVVAHRLADRAIHLQWQSTSVFPGAAIAIPPIGGCGQE